MTDRADPPTSTTLDDSFATGDRDLPGHILQACAVIGRRCTINELGQVLGLPPATLIESVEKLITTRRLIGSHHHLDFRTGSARATTYQHIPPPVRALLHHAAAMMINDNGGTADEAARHLHQGGNDGGLAAIDILCRAAEEVVGRAPAVAAAYLSQAMGIATLESPLWPQLCAVAVELFVVAGPVQQALVLGHRALGSMEDPSDRALLWLALAEGHKHRGHNRRAADCANNGLSCHPIPDRVAARLDAVRAHALIYDGDINEAAAAATRAIARGEASGEHCASVFGHTALSTIARTKGDLTGSANYAKRAVELADKFGGRAGHRHPRVWLGAAQAAIDDFANAEMNLTTARDEADTLGTQWSQPLTLFHHACLLAAQGLMERAIQTALEGLTRAEAPGAIQLCIPLHGLIATTAALRHDLPRARQHVMLMRRQLDAGVTAAPELIRWPVAAIHMAAGQHTKAFDELVPIYDALPRRLLMLIHDPGCGPTMVRLAMAAGDRGRAEAVVAASRLLADANPSVVSLVGAADHSLGLILGRLDMLIDAADRLRECRRPLMFADALNDAAQLANATGAGPEAQRLEKRAQAVLAQHGLSAGHHFSQVRHDSQPNDKGSLALLSARELEVALLVVEGHTNESIAAVLHIAPSTVDSHMRKIFQKLRINKRTKLAMIVERARKPAAPDPHHLP